MKLDAKTRQETSSATIIHSLGLIAGFSGLLAVASYAASPSWWVSPGTGSQGAVVTPLVITNGGVVTTNSTNDYAVVNEGQLKQFTIRAVDELNTNLNYSIDGQTGAGTNLATMVSNWVSEYATNGYSATNHPASDYQAMTSGQLKYVGNKVWNRLQAAGYIDTLPFWLDIDTATDKQVANVGQLKTVFNFDLSSFASVPHITSGATASGHVGAAFTGSDYTITADNTPTSFSASGLPVGLSVDSGSGVIAGTPMTAGTYTVALGAANASGTGHKVLTLTITISVPVITSANTASGTAGLPFSYTMTATNGPTSFYATNLPSGIGLDAHSGIIAGTPTAASTNVVGLSASNVGGTGPTTNMTLTIVNPPVPVITSGQPPSGTVGYGFSYTMTASNNPTGFYASNLPSGLHVGASSGVISGTPTMASSNSVTLSASNVAGTGPTTNFVFMINATGAPVITSGPVAYAFYNEAFTNYTITATNSPTSFGATSLPAGLSVDTGSGAITGTPTSTSTASVASTISASNATGTGSAGLLFIMNLPVPVITSPSTATGTVGASFDYAIGASNTPTSYSASGLSPGLIFNASTGAISGTPTAAGTYSVTLGATNQRGSATPVTLTVTISIPVPPPIITSGTAVTGNVGDAFSYTITALGGPTSFSIVGGTLPSGLSLDTSTGIISGTPSATGSSTVAIGALNPGGMGQANVTFTINASGAPLITSASTATGQVGSAFSYTITATNMPMTLTSTCFSATGLPPGLSLNTTTGAIAGTPSTIGLYNVTLHANNVGTGIATLTLTVNPATPVITSATTTTGTFGVAITPYTITASHGPTSFGATGLPPGLSLDVFTGLITGTPIASGTFSTTIGASNADGTQTGTTTLTFTIAGWDGLPILNNSIAAGDLASLMIKTDGTVWAAGVNFAGNLGNGTTTDSASYVPVTAVTDFNGIIAVAGGGDTSYALKNDGTVWAWGRNDMGELGNGGHGTNTDEPAPVSGLTDVIAIAGGEYFGMALKSDGTVWTWGDNSYGELGNGDMTFTDSDTPVQVTDGTGPLTGVIAIAGGFENGMALKSDGTVWEWGADDHDQLADGLGTGLPYAVPINGIGGITAISCGEFFSFALRNDGTVWTWGSNIYGELGIGIDPMVLSQTSTGPVQVVNLTGVTAISGGADHALALRNDGTVWAWGGNDYAGLGDGTILGLSTLPNQVSNLSEIVALAGGWQQNTVLKKDGTVWGWGSTGVWYYLDPVVVGNRQATYPPVISPAAGSYGSTQTISISTTVSGTIHYTLDGTEPTASSPSYSGTFSLSDSALISAGVFNGSGVLVTPISSSQYTFGGSNLPTTATSLGTSVISPHEIDLSWTLSGLVNYSAIYVYRSSDGWATCQLIAVLDPSATSYHDTNTVGGTAYEYKIGTFNNAGVSVTSAASATASSPDTFTITVTTPSGATNLP